MAAALSDAGSLEADVLRVAATTSRGAASSSADATRMEDLISQLEASNQPNDVLKNTRKVFRIIRSG